MCQTSPAIAPLVGRPNIYTADPATRLAPSSSSRRHVGSDYIIINVEEAQTGRET